MSKSNDEVELKLEAAAQGDYAALAELFDSFRPRLVRMIHLRLDRRLQRRIDPLDVVQDTFLAVRRKFPSYIAERKLPFFLWLRLETGQKLIDLHRFHLGAQMRDAGQEVSLHAGDLPSVESVTIAEQLLGRFTSASHAAMRAELKVMVQNVLNEMEPNDREMLVLRHFEELSNSEAAVTLGISATAAYNRYVRAIRRLKTAFAKMPEGLEAFLK